MRAAVVRVGVVRAKVRAREALARVTAEVSGVMQGDGCCCWWGGDRCCCCCWRDGGCRAGACMVR